MVWFHRAAVVASRLSNTASRAGWLIAGFYIPLVNLVMPYRQVRDLAPHRDAEQRLVKRWFGVYIALIVVRVIERIALSGGRYDAASLAHGATAFAIAKAVLAIAWVLTFRPVMRSVSDQHAAALAARAAAGQPNVTS